jgi:hypothetical protein
MVTFVAALGEAELCTVVSYTGTTVIIFPRGMLQTYSSITMTQQRLAVVRNRGAPLAAVEAYHGALELIMALRRLAMVPRSFI